MSEYTNFNNRLGRPDPEESDPFDQFWKILLLYHQRRLDPEVRDLYRRKLSLFSVPQVKEAWEWLIAQPSTKAREIPPVGVLLTLLRKNRSTETTPSPRAPDPLRPWKAMLFPRLHNMILNDSTWNLSLGDDAPEWLEQIVMVAHQEYVNGPGGKSGVDQAYATATRLLREAGV